MAIASSFLWVQLHSADADPLVFWFQQAVAGSVYTVEVPRALLGAMTPDALSTYVMECYLEEHPAEGGRVGREGVLHAVQRAMPSA